MKTEILNIYNEVDIKRATYLLAKGELVAIPTETVYGLAADAKNPEAIKNIFKVKGRPENHPLILHIDSAEKLTDWAYDIPDVAYQLAEHFWPGPLTLLLKKKPEVSDLITGGLDTIAIRVPANVMLRDIISRLDSGLVAPSANLHTKLSPTTAEHVLDHLGGKIAAVLDGDSCSVGIESTIISLIDQTPKVLRKGPITADAIQEALGIKVDVLETHGKKVSGNMLKHYQPHTKSLLMTADEILRYLKNSQNEDKKIALMYYSSMRELIVQPHAVKLSGDIEEYTKAMYQTLYQLDKESCDEIIIECPPHSSEWGAVWDRLKKACYQEN